MYLNTVNQWKVLLKLPDLYRLCYKNKIKLRHKLIYYRISINLLYWWCVMEKYRCNKLGISLTCSGIPHLRENRLINILRLLTDIPRLSGN